MFTEQLPRALFCSLTSVSGLVLSLTPKGTPPFCTENAKLAPVKGAIFDQTCTSHTSVRERPLYPVINHDNHSTVKHRPSLLTLYSMNCWLTSEKKFISSFIIPMTADHILILVAMTLRWGTNCCFPTSEIRNRPTVTLHFPLLTVCLTQRTQLF